MKLGVFDSGIGGKAVAKSLERSFPDAEIIRVDDHENVPYGDKSQQEIQKLTDNAIQPLLSSGCDIIILACNSATAAAIEFLRQKYPAQVFIGLEPMIKPAVELTRSGIIAVCATPSTLKSSRYHRLKEKFASDTTILEPDCSQWARLIEDSEINEKHISDVISPLLDAGADVIVLACTHYHWINLEIAKLADGKATVIQPSEAIARRVKQLASLD